MVSSLRINDDSTQAPLTPKDSGLRTKKICCTLCVVASVVVMVSFPVGVLVVGPMIAQKILDGTTISLPNSTISTCTTKHALVQNIAKINVPFFLPSTLLPYTQVLSTPIGSNVTSIGSYVSPELHLSGGESTQTFDSRLDVTDTSVILNDVVVPMFGLGHKIRLILSAEDVTISVLGIKLKGLKMHKELTCKKEKILHMSDPLPLPNKVCHPGQNRTGFEQDTSAG